MVTCKSILPIKELDFIVEFASGELAITFYMQKNFVSAFPWVLLISSASEDPKAYFMDCKL